MKKLLNKDSIAQGVIATLVSELLCALVVWLILVLIHHPVVDNLRFFAVAFVPPALLLRYYAHAKDYPTTLKAVITTFFVTVVLFMWAMLRYKFITF
jgi:RsiW-degrading membrane proteinase PrsW (M82 family)